MSQPPAGGGQRGVSQPFFIPTLTPMHSLQQQQVVITSGNGVPTAIATPAFGQTQAATVMPSVSALQQPIPSADLYLCNTSNTATDPPAESNGSDLKKASIEVLEESYKELNSRNIKDSLSSFLPHMPGGFDSMESPETKLKHLLDQRPIGNKEFHLLSGHALLGFRLLPGPLPEQYRIDPPSQETRTQHHKKKHKHRSIEKAGDDGSDLNPPSSKVKMPNDAYNFIKSDSSSLLIPATPPATHMYTTPGDRSLSQSMQKVVVSGGGHGYSPTIVPTQNMVSGASINIHDPIKPFPGGKKKKEKKRNKEKKRDKKEKKKKKDKHHGQDPPGPLPGPVQSIHPPPTH